MAYAYYLGLMDMAEDLISSMVYAIHGSYKIKWQPMAKEEVELDFTPPWPRFPMVETIEARANISIPRGFDNETHEYLEEAMSVLEAELVREGALNASDKLVGVPRTLAR